MPPEIDEEQVEELDPNETAEYESESEEDDEVEVEVEEEEAEDRGDVYTEDEDDEEEDSEDEDEEPVEDEEDSEEEDEDEEVESEDEEDSEDDEEDDDDGNQRVPRSRLNQVIQQREAEKERSAWLEEQLEILIKQRGEAPAEPEVPAEPDFDFIEAEERYSDLLIEGSTKEAAALRREITGESTKELQRQIAEGVKLATEESLTKTTQTLEEEKFNVYLDKVSAEKSYLDADSDDYNEKAVKMANSLMTSYMTEGLTKTKALAQAINDISSLFEEPEKPALGKKKASARTKATRKRAAKAAERQPPSTERRSASKGTRDLETINIAKMSEKAFNSLTKKEKASLRGD